MMDNNDFMKYLSSKEIISYLEHIHTYKSFMIPVLIANGDWIKSIIFIEACGIHAKEWLSISKVLCVISKLIDNN